VRRLRRVLVERLGESTAVTTELPGARALSPEERDDLEALGYLGGG